MVIIRYLLFILVSISLCSQPVSHKTVKLNPDSISSRVSRIVSGPALVFSGDEAITLKEKLLLMQAEINFWESSSSEKSRTLSQAEQNFDNYKKITDMEIEKLKGINDVLLKTLKGISEALEKDGKKRRSRGILKIIESIGIIHSIDKSLKVIKRF